MRFSCATDAGGDMRSPVRGSGLNVLVVDVGGTNIKILASGHHRPIVIPSGPTLTPTAMVSAVRTATQGWTYAAVSIGYPGAVVRGVPVNEPHNLARGWVGFDFARAFRRPTKVVNDAAMQALGSYRGGCMLFLGLGTGLGSALIVGGVLGPTELAHLPYAHGGTFEDYLGMRGLKRLGLARWRTHVFIVSTMFKKALSADYVVLGGGNVRHLKRLPRHIFRGSNDNAFRGGFRLWRTAQTRIR